MITLTSLTLIDSNFHHDQVIQAGSPAYSSWTSGGFCVGRAEQRSKSNVLDGVMRTDF